MISFRYLSSLLAFPNSCLSCVNKVNKPGYKNSKTEWTFMCCAVYGHGTDSLVSRIGCSFCAGRFDWKCSAIIRYLCLSYFKKANG